MNVGKLKRVAIKEFKKSPAKTCILIGLLPVALYFCVPLFLGTGKTSAVAVPTPGKADFILPTPNPKATQQNPGPKSWVSVASNLDSDLLALPAALPKKSRNPFAWLVTEVPANEAEADVEQNDEEPGLTQEELQKLEQQRDALAKSRDPIAELELQLNATMVGKRARLATINGKSYEQGESIHVMIIESIMGSTNEEEEQVTNKELKLLHVDRQFVVVEMDGKQHQLQLRNQIPKDAIVVKPRPAAG